VPEGALGKGVTLFGVLNCVRLDLRVEEAHDLLPPFAHPADVVEHCLAVDQIAEEELEQPFVPVLEEVALASQPLVERLLSSLREPKHLPPPAGLRALLDLDQPHALEPIQLRVDLSEARAPEEPGRELDGALDVVAA